MSTAVISAPRSGTAVRALMGLSVIVYGWLAYRMALIIAYDYVMNPSGRANFDENFLQELALEGTLIFAFALSLRAVFRIWSGVESSSRNVWKVIEAQLRLFIGSELLIYMSVGPIVSFPRDYERRLESWNRNLPGIDMTLRKIAFVGMAFLGTIACLTAGLYLVWSFQQMIDRKFRPRSGS